MSSDRGLPGADSRGFVRTEFRDRYEEILRERLSPEMQGFSAFFSKLARLETLAAMLRRHLPPGDGAALNIGSGPFAAEIFVAALQDRWMVAIDYTRAFAPFYGIFRAEGVLPRTSFMQADALTIAFRPAVFDAVLIHDVLYETGLDAAELVGRFAPTLRPGGLLYLDFMNAGTERLWRWLGKERAYRRYRPRDVLRIVEKAGFEVIEIEPHSGSDHPAVRLFHWVLWTVLRTSNTYAVVARKTAPEGGAA